MEQLLALWRNFLPGDDLFDARNENLIWLFVDVPIDVGMLGKQGLAAQKEILDWFHMVRGCNSVLQSQWETLSHSFLAPLLNKAMTQQTAPSHLLRNLTAPLQPEMRSQVYANTAKPQSQLQTPIAMSQSLIHLATRPSFPITRHLDKRT
ncbi:hypothetical protein PAAG_12184 [Paracoccidioides lutzii Pb01]|uniref:Uncharacterized protein n=1 Tax=Paracoccidioides lutzii (strain ATCC MYA-826 / Pb01) TaxID=502779 RepID=A0A0A2V026_PARBA|nr:hypothetical protein PAAG_12184 [Paracoccidioides lutzii Pb01]KGQ01146.1 hypothetical protein PAAG_12184 [Paracoccidioides lutzii Pb01]